MQYQIENALNFNNNEGKVCLRIFSAFDFITIEISGSVEIFLFFLRHFFTAMERMFVQVESLDEGLSYVLFRKSSESLIALNKFCVEYSIRSGSKDIWNIYNFIRDLAEGSHFGLLRYTQEISIEGQQTIVQILRSLDAKVPFEVMQRNCREYNDTVLKFYDVLSEYCASKRRENIGHKNLSERKCRLCGRSVPDVTFKKRAHAISELLGNKSIILYDECDECNSGQVNRLEESLAAFFSLLRTTLGVSGKKGVPSYNGNCDVKVHSKNPGEVEVKIISLENSSFEMMGKSCRFKTCTRPFPKRDLYKIFCKFVISVLPTECFDYEEFSKLREWILSDDRSDEILPTIAMVYDASENPHSPQITVYKRKWDARKDIPLYLCDFLAVSHRFIFELPLVESNIVMGDREDWERLFKLMPPLKRSLDNWSFGRYDDSKSESDDIYISVVVSNSRSKKM